MTDFDILAANRAIARLKRTGEVKIIREPLPSDSTLWRRRKALTGRGAMYAKPNQSP